MRTRDMNRRRLLQTSLAVGGLGLAGCATAPRGEGMRAAGLPIQDIPPKLAPVRAHPDRLVDVRHQPADTARRRPGRDPHLAVRRSQPQRAEDVIEHGTTVRRRRSRRPEQRPTGRKICHKRINQLQFQAESFAETG